MIKFSIVIPTYNRLNNLKKALNSILNQTYQTFQIVIVDDGSKDGTQEYISSLNNIKIKYVWQENSGLPSVARNNGIKITDFEWVCFLDSDDFWEDDKLEKVKNAIENNPDAIAVSHSENLIVNGIFQKKLIHGTDAANVYERLLFQGNCFSTSAMTVKKEILEKINGFNISSKYYIVEDYELWLRISKEGKIISIKDICGNYCLGQSDNISSNVSKLYNNLKNVIKDHINKLDNNYYNIEQLLKQHLARIDYYEAREYQTKGLMKKAIPLLMNSIKEYPFDIKKYASLFFALTGIKK